MNNSKDTNGANITQWKYKGGKNQQWKFVCVDSNNNLYKIVSVASSSGKVVDIEYGGSSNNTNVSLYTSKNSSNQIFCLNHKARGCFSILSKCSNYKSGLTIKSASCAQGGNVIQYQYNASHNDEWFLEPVLTRISLGTSYADKNASTYNTYTYPNFKGHGGDCANFVSQCLAASGLHYSGNWYIYKKTNILSGVDSANDINKYWEVPDPSPWISAPEFNKYWSSRASYTSQSTIEYELAFPEEAFRDSHYNIGDVVQYGTYTSWGGFSAEHTMYITGYDLTNYTYRISAHSNDRNNYSLKLVCESLKGKNKHIKFFDVI